MLEHAAGGGGTEVLRKSAWRDSDAFQHSILTSAQLSVMVTDVNGIIQLFSVGAERMLGYSAVEVVNRIALVDIHDPQDLMVRAQAVSSEFSAKIAPAFEAITCKAARGVEDRYESILIRKNRERVAAALSITALRDDNGRVVGYTLIVNDTSARKAIFPKSDLLTRMSHEMRTPLSAILGFAQLMNSGKPSPTISQRRSIDRILQAGWYLEKLMNMTRDLALIDLGALSMSQEPVPLAVVMLDCQALIEPQSKARGVRVTFPVFETHCSVAADRVRLQEALGNLLSAAIEYIEVDGALAVNCETHGSEWVHIGIRDVGDASSAERGTRRVQPFDGLEQTATAATGTGLSLLLAKRLIELMGGAIGGERIGGSREIFSFDLKRALVPPAAGHAARHSALAESAISGGGLPQSTVHLPDIHPQ